MNEWVVIIGFLVGVGIAMLLILAPLNLFQIASDAKRSRIALEKLQAALAPDRK